MKNILLPTDFSENSWSAIAYALQLYKDVNCTFYLLNASAILVSTATITTKKLSQTIYENDKKQLLDIKNKIELNDPNSNHECKILLSSETLSSAVDSAVTKFSIDVIVMGTKGASGLKEVFLGSNTVNIINKTKNCSVLAVPENYKFIAPKQLLFPTNFSRNYDNKQIQALLDLANLNQAHTSVLYVEETVDLTEIQKENKALLKTNLKGANASFYAIPKENKIDKHIDSFIKEHEINLLIMVKHKRSFFENLTKEPIIKRIGFGVTIPFLLLPTPY